MACSLRGDVVRTAGVHAGGGDCNRAVEVCVSGFGTQIEIAGETIRGSGSNGSNGWSVGGWAVACAGCRGETHRKRRHELYSGYGRGVRRKKKTQQQCTRTRAEVFAVTRRGNGIEGDLSLSVGQARQRLGSGKMGGGGVKRDQQASQIERGRRGAAGQAQASEEGVWSGQWAGK